MTNISYKNLSIKVSRLKYEESKNPCFDDCIFCIRTFETLEDPLEKIRYFLLYNQMSQQTFDIIKDQILYVLNVVIQFDISYVFQGLLMIANYNCYLPSNDFLIHLITNAIFDVSYIHDAIKIIRIYTEIYGKIFDQAIIDKIFEQSLLIEQNEKNEIWNIISVLTSKFNYEINQTSLSKILTNYKNLSYSEKESLLYLLRSMLLSENSLNISNFFLLCKQCTNLFISIFNDCQDANERIVIDIILLMEEKNIHFIDAKQMIHHYLSQMLEINNLN